METISKHVEKRLRRADAPDYLQMDIMFTHQLIHGFFVKIHPASITRYIFELSQGNYMHMRSIWNINEKMIFHYHQWNMNIENVDYLRRPHLRR